MQPLPLERLIQLQSFKNYVNDNPDTAPEKIFKDFETLLQKYNELTEDYNILRSQHDQKQRSLISKHSLVAKSPELPSFVRSSSNRTNNTHPAQ